MADPAVAAFIDEHSDAELLPSGKVRCTVTHHEVVASLELLREHWAGKRYKTKKGQSKYDFTQHEPWIVPHTKNPHLLYCTLTKQPMSRQPKTVAGHVSGKRFQRLLEEQQQSGVAVEDGKKKGGPRAKKRVRDEDLSDGDEGADDEGEELLDDEEEDDEGEELLDDDDEDDPGMAAFLREGAFWERDGEEKGGEEDEEDEDEEDEEDDDEDDEEEVESDDEEGGDEGGAGSDDGDEAFWVRGSSEALAKPKPKPEASAAKAHKKGKAAGAKATGAKAAGAKAAGAKAAAPAAGAKAAAPAGGPPPPPRPKALKKAPRAASEVAERAVGVVERSSGGGAGALAKPKQKKMKGAAGVQPKKAKKAPRPQ